MGFRKSLLPHCLWLSLLLLFGYFLGEAVLSCSALKGIAFPAHFSWPMWFATAPQHNAAEGKQGRYGGIDATPFVV
jgi:hypothetical protein